MLGNRVRRMRSIFKYVDAAGLIGRRVRFGPNFKQPSLKTLRAARNQRGPRIFEAAEIHKLLDAANPQIKAMIMLGIRKL